MNSSVKISSSEMGTTICNRLVAEINCSNWQNHWKKAATEYI
jgi:hypothetical protein